MALIQSGENADPGGDYNVGIGYRSVRGGAGTFSSAQYNTGIGFKTLEALTTGDSNTGIGTSALNAVTTGAGNCVIGGNAGDAINSGDNNTAIGRDSLSALTTQSGFVAIGALALSAAAPNVVGTGSESQIAIGPNALELANGAGAAGYCRYNIAIGYRNLRSLATTTDPETSDHNVSIGHRSMETSPEGTNYNVTLGNLTLTSATAVNRSVAIGHQALAVAAADDNIALGYEAGLVADGC